MDTYNRGGQQGGIPRDHLSRSFRVRALRLIAEDCPLRLTKMGLE